MSYRQASSFDPRHASAPTRPKRPFNWVQWLGVLCEGAAIAILLWHFAVRLDVVPGRELPIQYATLAALVGITLINSRTEDMPRREDDPTRRRYQWWLTVTLTVIGVVAVILIGLDLAS
ncbi:hypothetical protein [Sphingomonas humi]|uniref:Uncharacterized protein n=1 Tax=Sphingomonas humi TaxID=335630 RepID=A0ABP7RH25_9SPHN